MADIKTKANDASVERFLEGIADPRRRDDALAIVKMMKAVTRMPPKMWGPAKLEDVDMVVLKQLVAASYKRATKTSTNP